MAAEREGEFTFEIVEHIGTINTFKNGWTKELNIVRWNGGKPKFDIREWDENHERMTRGVTLHDYEAKKVYELLQKKAV